MELILLSSSHQVVEVPSDDIMMTLFIAGGLLLCSQ